MTTPPTSHEPATLYDLFDLRLAIARIGEADWMQWWDSHALAEHGQYALRRVFRRTPAVSGADLAFRAARRRHHEAAPQEPLLHLFDFGESFEGEFARWLIGQKEEGWTPEVPPAPTDEQRADVALALSTRGVTPREDLQPRGDAVKLGDVEPMIVDTVDGVLQLARALAGAYAASKPRHLVVPYFRASR